MSSKVRGFDGINDIFCLYPMFIYYSMVNIQADMFRQFDKLWLGAIAPVVTTQGCCPQPIILTTNALTSRLLFSLVADGLRCERWAVVNGQGDVIWAGTGDHLIIPSGTEERRWIRRASTRFRVGCLFSSPALWPAIALLASRMDMKDEIVIRFAFVTAAVLLSA
jgi:hypothetical protein